MPATKKQRKAVKVRKARILKKHRVEVAVGFITEAAKLLGWHVALPNVKGVRYLIIGEEKQLDRIVAALDKADNIKRVPFVADRGDEL